MTRLRHIAAINPDTPGFDQLESDALLPFVPLEAVWPEGLDVSRLKPKFEVATGYTRFQEGDIVIPKITPTFQADRSTIASGLDGGVAAGTTELHVVRVHPGVDARYVRYLLSSREFLDGGEAEMIGVAGQKRVPDVWLRDLWVPLTDLATQRAIADYLDAETARIDALIAKKQRMIETLLGRRAVVTTLGVAGMLSPGAAFSAGPNWLPQIPSGWRVAKLTLVARLGSGHTPSRSHPEWWVNCTIPWITTGEVAEMRSDRLEYVNETRERISDLGIANSSATVHPAGTVVLCRTASAGYSAIMATDMATSQDFATWTCGPLLRPRYLLLCLRAMREDLLGRLAMGSTHKTIYMPDIEAIRIPLPPVDEQDQIVEQVWQRLHRIDRIVDSTERQIDLLREHRQALITAAVTGEFEVPGVAA